MDIIQVVGGIFISVIGALGGWEAIKWFLNRKDNQRVTGADADKKETEADADEFHLLREQIEFLQKQLLDKETRFAEQTNVVRDLNRQLLESSVIIGKRDARVAELEAERNLKLCERRGCGRREPQSGY